MINKLLNFFKDVDKYILILINKGVKFGFFICVSALILLISYHTYFKIPNLYHISISLFKTGLMYAVGAFVCGFSIDLIKKQMI